MEHIAGTREWAFAEVEHWLDDPNGPQLFWLMGGGGTGKSVISAVLLGRFFSRAAAWHFCRHDNKEQSSSLSLLHSVAAMLCCTVRGYAKALEGVKDLDNALLSTDTRAVFEALIASPLAQVENKPNKPMLVLIDALDEIPREFQQPVGCSKTAWLRLRICTHLSRIPG